MTKLPSTKRESLQALADFARRVRDEINAGYRYSSDGGEAFTPDQEPEYEGLTLDFTVVRKNTGAPWPGCWLNIYGEDDSA